MLRFVAFRSAKVAFFHFCSGWARALRFAAFTGHSPDGLRRSANKVSAIGREPPGMRYRSGFTKLELLVAATLLSTMFAIVSPLFSRLNQVWHSTRWYQLASQELMNQMESITQLSRQECNAAIQKLEIAPEILAAIPGAELTGKMDPSSDGDRIVLSIQLPASVRSEPILLVGWLHGHELDGEVRNQEVSP